MALRTPSRPRRALVAAAALGVVLVVSACNDDPNSIAAQAKAGDQKGFVAGNGAVEQLAPAQRGSPISLSGKLVAGGTWSRATDAAGKVVVVNVWGSWCGPCVAETPHLQSAWAAYEKAKKPVQFIGLDYNEAAATGAAYLSANDVTYPSISNEASGEQPLLMLAGKADNTPTTLVLDRQGRIAARVLGGTTESTLTALVDDVLAEKA